MGRFREALEKEGDRFVLPPGGLERFHRRHSRRERNRRIGAGVLALLLGVGGTLFIARAFRGIPPGPRPAGQPRITGTFSVESRPHGIAAGEGALWVVSLVDRSVTRLDPSTGNVVARIETPADIGPPVDVTLSGDSVWVKTGFVDRSSAGVPAVNTPAVLQLDPTSNRIVARIVLEHDAHPGIAVGGGSLWSGSSGSGTVSRYDLSQGDVISSVQGPAPLVALAFGEDAVWSLGGGRGDIDPPIPGTLARIAPDTGSVTASSEIGVRPRDLAVAQGAVWVVSAGERAVFRVDPATVQATDRIPVPGVPTQIAVGPAEVWVLDIADGILFRIDTKGRRITRSINVGSDPVAVAAGAGSVFVARDDGKILRIEV